MRKLLVGIFTSVVLLLFATITPALAAPDVPYIGFSVADSTFSDGEICSASEFCNDADTGFKVYGGIGLSETLAVEYYYADLGEATAEVDDKGPDNFSRTYGVEVFGIDVVANLPLNERFSVFGKAGAAWWEWNAEFSGKVPSVLTWRTTGSDSGYDLKLGIGGKYNLQDNIDLRLEVEDYDIGGESITLISFGVTMGLGY